MLFGPGRSPPEPGPSPNPTPDRRGADVARPLKVLIVEDEPISALDLESIAEDGGHAVVALVDSPGAALAAVARYSPDVVVMDVRLANGGDGIDAAVEIRRRYGTPSIFFTAHADAATRERAAAADPLDFLVKPVSAARFSAALALARDRIQRES